MWSINDIVDVAQPVITDAVAKAALQERRHVLLELKRIADRSQDVRQVRAWIDSNIALLDATGQL